MVAEMGTRGTWDESTKVSHTVKNNQCCASNLIWQREKPGSKVCTHGALGTYVLSKISKLKRSARPELCPPDGRVLQCFGQFGSKKKIALGRTVNMNSRAILRVSLKMGSKGAKIGRNVVFQNGQETNGGAKTCAISPKAAHCNLLSSSEVAPARPYPSGTALHQLQNRAQQSLHRS